MKNISGLLVAIDFQKAFDSIKRSFLVKGLSILAFNFAPSLIYWIQTFYKNITSTAGASDKAIRYRRTYS